MSQNEEFKVVRTWRLKPKNKKHGERKSKGIVFIEFLELMQGPPLKGEPSANV